MSQNSASPNAAPQESRLPRLIALFVVIAFFLGTSAITYWNTRTVRESSHWVAHTQEVIVTLEDVLSLMKDAETGQRGFIITGEEKYLEPYNAAIAAIDGRLKEFARLTADSSNQQAW